MKLKVGDRIAYTLGHFRCRGTISNFFDGNCLRVSKDHSSDLSYIIDTIQPKFNIKRLKKVKK